MKQIANICFIQLPPPDTTNTVFKANIPLAAGYIMAYAIAGNKSYLNKMQIVPKQIMNHGGDEMLVNWLISSGANVFAFTCYMWNIERSLYLAQRIKESVNNSLIIIGGPEIIENRLMLENNFVDFYVTGEGEKIFSDIINNNVVGKKQSKFIKQENPLDLNLITNPYPADILPLSKNETMLLETMRGCSSKCTYCYYGKSFPKIRYFEKQEIEKFFLKANKSDIKEIYIMDPSFDHCKNLNDKLSFIAKCNASKIPIHTEIHLETVNEKNIHLFKDAGISSVEAGLQSTNPLALKNVKRKFNMGKFLKGAELVQKNNIKITTGLIVGLPGDTLEGFEETLDFVISNDLSEGVEIYPLSVLPGSTLSETASKDKIEYMKAPPYYATSTNTMKYDDFVFAEDIVKQKLDMDLYEPVLAHFYNHDDIITFMDLRRKIKNDELINLLKKIGNNLTLLINHKNLSDLNLFKEIDNIISDSNPFTLVQIVVECNKPLENKAAKDLNRIFSNNNGYFENTRIFHKDNQNRYSVRFFQITSNIETFIKLDHWKTFWDPLFNIKKGMNDNAYNFLKNKIPMIVIDKNISQKELNKILSIYKNYESFIMRSDIDI